MQAGAIGKVLLTPAFLCPEPPKVFCEALPYIHDGSTTPLSPINLQTISDNLLDCSHGWSMSSVTDRRQMVMDMYMPRRLGMVVMTLGVAVWAGRKWRHHMAVRRNIRSRLDTMASASDENGR